MNQGHIVLLLFLIFVIAFFYHSEIDSFFGNLKNRFNPDVGNSTSLPPVNQRARDELNKAQQDVLAVAPSFQPETEFYTKFKVEAVQYLDVFKKQKYLYWCVNNGDVDKKYAEMEGYFSSFTKAFEAEDMRKAETAYNSFIAGMEKIDLDYFSVVCQDLVQTNSTQLSTFPTGVRTLDEISLFTRNIASLSYSVICVFNHVLNLASVGIIPVANVCQPEEKK
jgi:hypothetical protein